MLKKSFVFIVGFFIIASSIGCATRFSVVKENPSSPKLSEYKSIYIGWLDLNEDNWKTYGYTSKNIWVSEVKKHNVNGLQEYFKADNPGKTIYGASSKTETYSGKGDLVLKLKLIKLGDALGWAKDDYLSVDVEFVDGKSGKSLYMASITMSSFAPFPRNWKANSFEGRLDNQLYNLSWGIADKLK